MKNEIYGILKARFLVDENAFKNWRFILFCLTLVILMIWNINIYEQKIFKINEMTSQMKELRSEFVDRRSELMELKLESTIENKMKEENIFPSSVPPKKIMVRKEEEASFFERIWQ